MEVAVNVLPGQYRYMSGGSREGRVYWSGRRDSFIRLHTTSTVVPWLDQILRGLLVKGKWVLIQQRWLPIE